MSTNPDMSAAPDERALDELSMRLTQALQILDLHVDNKLLLSLAEETTNAVGPGAGPISTFLVGYAAGSKSTDGKPETTAEVERAVSVAKQATEKSGRGGIDDGWAHTAQ
jgi:hypothetical protein